MFEWFNMLLVFFRGTNVWSLNLTVEVTLFIVNLMHVLQLSFKLEGLPNYLRRLFGKQIISREVIAGAKAAQKSFWSMSAPSVKINSESYNCFFGRMSHFQAFIFS